MSGSERERTIRTLLDELKGKEFYIAANWNKGQRRADFELEREKVLDKLDGLGLEIDRGRLYHWQSGWSRAEP